MIDDESNRIDKAIAAIEADNTSGAAEILRRCAGVFSPMKRAGQGSISIGLARQTILRTCVALVSAQPDMSSLLRLASETLKAARAKSTGPEALAAAADAASDFLESANAAAHGAALNAVNLISEGSTVLTHSRSSTVLETFIEARRAGKSFEVILTESRPMFEGRKLAIELVASQIKVTVIADAAASLLLERADTVVVGADKITPGHAVNKIGTRMIALAARERGLSTYSVCDTSKFIAMDYLPNLRRNEADASELWPDAPEGIELLNSYFEKTPLEFFTSVVTEHGTLGSAEASDCAREAYVDPALIGALRSLRLGIK